MQAVIYTRISRDRTGAGLGVERQRDDCLELADRLGWTVVKEYSDNDISAYSGKRRPGYEQMMDRLRSGNVDAIIAWHTDRLHRRPIELEDFIDACEEHKVDIRTVRGGDLDLSTASGRMVARMLGASARHEVEHSIERQKRAKKQAALDGKFRGGRRSFGYEADGLSLRKEEADALRRAYGDVLSGKSLRAISREWNEAGLRTSHSGGTWTSTSTRRVLLRERNAGLVRVDDQPVQASWEPVVNADTFQAVTALLTSPDRRSSLSWERNYMGSSTYVCGLCGAPMRITQNKGNSTYVCSAGAHLGRIQDVLDEYVSEVIISRLSAPDAAIILATPEVDVPGLRARRDALNVRLDEAAGLFAEGTLTASQLKAATEKLRADLDAVEAEIVRAQEVSALAHLALDEGGIREAWDALPVDLRNKVVKALMTVTVMPTGRGRKTGGGYFDPDSVRIDWTV